MAISATFELRENGGSSVYAAFLKAYTVVDLDYTLKRTLDKTGRPSSVATIDFLKISIRGTKEIQASFHEWISKPDKLMDGIIKIYDSTGYVAGIAQDFSGGETADLLQTINDFESSELEDNMNSAMEEDPIGDEVDNQEDVFDEMSREDLLKYIKDNNLSITINQDDTLDIIKHKIRYYKKISKMKENELKDEAKRKNIKDWDSLSKDKLLEELKKENNNWDGKKPPKTAEKPLSDTRENMKKDTTKTASSVVTKAVKEIGESARSITFENAYCVSLREHFHGDPSNQGTLDSSYPWILEIGVKPGSLKVTGWNVGGGSALPVNFTFFT